MIFEKLIKEIDWKFQTFETEDGEILPFVNEEINVDDIKIPIDNVIYVYKHNETNEVKQKDN